MKTIILLFIAAIIIPFDNHAQNFSGIWEGSLTQNEGGYSPSYQLILNLKQDGKELKGTSRVIVDHIFVEMAVEGVILNDFYMYIKDIKIIKSHKEAGMEWCFKTYRAILKKEKSTTKILEGTWDGKTSFSDCIPGNILLKKYVPRA